MKSIFWKAYTHHDRILATNQIEDIIHNFGYITDVNPFSDIAITFKIELPEDQIIQLYDALSNYLTLDSLTDIASESKTEANILLNITFTKGTGNKRNEIPSMPG